MLIHTRELVKVYRMGESGTTSYEIRALDRVSVDIAQGDLERLCPGRPQATRRLMRGRLQTC
jgi:hypothetical protein